MDDCSSINLLTKKRGGDSTGIKVGSLFFMALCACVCAVQIRQRKRKHTDTPLTQITRVVWVYLRCLKMQNIENHIDPGCATCAKRRQLPFVCRTKNDHAAIQAALAVYLLRLNAALDCVRMPQCVCLPYAKAGSNPALAHQIRAYMFVCHTQNHAMRDCLPYAALLASSGHHAAMIAGYAVRRC